MAIASNVRFQAAQAASQAPRTQTAANDSALASMNAVRSSMGLAPQEQIVSSRLTAPTSFAPGSRPDVLTVNRGQVYSNGKLMVDYGIRDGAEQKARDHANRFISNGKSIEGDQGGQVFRQLYRTNQGTQTGEYAGAAERIMNGQRNIRPSLNTSNMPQTYTRNAAAEQQALSDSLRSGAQGGANNGAFADGSDVSARLAGDPALAGLLQEQVNMRTYGTARPTFASAANIGPSPTVLPDTRVAPGMDAGGGMVPGAGGGTGTTDSGASGGAGQDYSALLELLGRYNQDTGGFEEQYLSARDRELAQQQEAVNAVNSRYAQLIGRERERGESEQARARAISNIGGGLYSPRTEARQNDIGAFTGDAARALEGQRSAELGGLRGEASSQAMQITQANQAAAQANRAGYTNTLLSLYERMQQDKAMTQQQALAEAGMTGSYNGAPTMDYLNYQRGLGNDQFDQSMDLRNFGLSEQQLDLQRNQMEQQGYQFTQLDDGTYGYFNANTQEFVRQGSAARPVSSGGGGGGADTNYQFKELADGSYGYFDADRGQYVSLGSAIPMSSASGINFGAIQGPQSSAQ